MKKILVTGGLGFIGSNFIRYMLKKYDDYFIVNMDKETYAGNSENLKDIENNPRYRFHLGDIANQGEIEIVVMENDPIDYVVHFAAESHVDRSISGSEEFIRTNIVGTHTLLEVFKRVGVERFINISTDEVYGSCSTEKFTEHTSIKPSSPYSASKASADLITKSYFTTYKMPVIITRCSNNYGEYQYPEKLIPLLVTNALEGKHFPIYGNGKNVRDWIHVSDHCRAIDTVLHKGADGEVYNIGGDAEKTNLEIANVIIKYLGIGSEYIEYVKDRPGHDLRYAIDHGKISSELGWSPAIEFEEGIIRTVEWYKNNQQWWKKLKNG